MGKGEKVNGGNKEKAKREKLYIGKRVTHSHKHKGEEGKWKGEK